MRKTGLERRENLSRSVFDKSPSQLSCLISIPKKNIFHSRITILLALGAAILVAAPPNNPHLPMADSQAVIRRYRRSVADPTTLSSEALELLTKRHFYEQQKTRDQCYKTFLCL
jgi:hypothetical protein